MVKRKVDLYVTSEPAQSRLLIQLVESFAAKRPHVICEIKPVLDYPADVVRLQIFYTPALVIDGKLIEMGLSSRDELNRILSTLI